MRWKKRGKNEIIPADQALSNIYSSRGDLTRLGAYLYTETAPTNFIISGSTDPNSRLAPLYQYLHAFMGRYPMIVLHNGDSAMEDCAADVWNKHELGDNFPLWIVNQEDHGFEPFFGMDTHQVISVMRMLAARLNYTITPRLERVVRAHISILQEIEMPVSLCGFHYLCQFTDMGEFHDRILEQHGEVDGNRIWADLGAGSAESDNQFDLFRAVISNLAGDAAYSGWESSKISMANCLEAIRRQATLLLSVNDLHTELLLPYIVQELKSYSGRPFILLTDGIRIGKDLAEYLRSMGEACYFGLVSENIVDAVGNGSNDFLRLAEKVGCFIFFKHGTGTTATSISDVMGKGDYTRIDGSEGESTRFFRILPSDKHKDIRYSTENRYRVMPEIVTGLYPDQAIIFDADADKITFFN